MGADLCKAKFLSRSENSHEEYSSWRVPHCFVDIHSDPRAIIGVYVCVVARSGMKKQGSFFMLCS